VCLSICPFVHLLYFHSSICQSIIKPTVYPSVRLIAYLSTICFSVCQPVSLCLCLWLCTLLSESTLMRKKKGALASFLYIKRERQIT
jgi:hypothetical protein